MPIIGRTFVISVIFSLTIVFPVIEPSKRKKLPARAKNPNEAVTPFFF